MGSERMRAARRYRRGPGALFLDRLGHLKSSFNISGYGRRPNGHIGTISWICQKGDNRASPA